jgi:RNA polymerase sigma-70 factor (ECF subfamily)
MTNGIELDLTEKDGNTLWKLYQNGVVAAFEELYDRHFDRLVGFLHAKFGLSQYDAEGIAQEAFLKVHRNRHSFSPDRAAFKTWLFTIAKRTAISEHNLARNRYEQSLELEDRNGEEYTVTEAREQELFRAPDRIAESEELGNVLRKAIQDLKPVYRETTRRIFVNGEKYKDVAADEGVAIGTIKSRVYRARQRLQDRLSEYV